MGLIADECPRCKRVTRCLVIERGGFVGGVVLGIPFALPLSTVQCVCVEYGHEFQSRSVAEDRAIPPEVAAGLDTDTLLARSNPDLWRARTLSGLRADPRLRDAFLLLDRLAPGPLYFGLRSDVIRWPALNEPDREDLLWRVDACARAEAFARSIAGRYTMGTAGCVAGVVLAVGVWTVAGLTLGHLELGGWVMVGDDTYWSARSCRRRNPRRNHDLKARSARSSALLFLTHNLPRTVAEFSQQSRTPAPSANSRGLRIGQGRSTGPRRE
jgi:hypothetical protein